MDSPYTVVVTASDGTYTSSTFFTWTINDPITITDPAVQNVCVGASVSVQIAASDASSGTLHYGATGMPAGLTINATTGCISGTILNSSVATGIFFSSVTATDGTSSRVRSCWCGM